MGGEGEAGEKLKLGKLKVEMGDGDGEKLRLEVWGSRESSAVGGWPSVRDEGEA